jgi:hypothetical protein
MVLAMIWLLHGEVSEVVGEMIRRSSTSIPVWINWIGRGSPSMRAGTESSKLPLHITTIIASTKVILLISFEATGGYMANFGTNLTDRPSTLPSCWFPAGGGRGPESRRPAGGGGW